MWTDDCGAYAIHMLASLAMPYMHTNKETQDELPGLFLIRQTHASVYEWWLLDPQYTLEDYCE